MDRRKAQKGRSAMAHRSEAEPWHGCGYSHMQGYRYPSIPAYLCTLHNCIQLTDCMIACNYAIVYTSTSCGLCAWYRIACMPVCLFSCARLVFSLCACFPALPVFRYFTSLASLCKRFTSLFLLPVLFWFVWYLCLQGTIKSCLQAYIIGLCAFSLVCVFDTVN